MSNAPQLTQLLKLAQTGDRQVLDELLPVVYDELRRLASRQLRKERADHTLQATALVHEAYVRLIDQREVDWRNRAHFFALAAEMMRRILINHALERKAAKRGGEQTKLALDEALDFASERELDLEVLDAALDRLARYDRNQSRIVEMKFFAGLTIEEIAAVMDLSPATVKREWRAAKAWLFDQIK